jgi:predicted acetyltransferase
VTVLVEPDAAHLPGYVAALRTGWSPNTGRDVSAEHLAEIDADPASFLADLTRRSGGVVPLRNGTPVPRLPGRVLWIWDADFCGAINVRFVAGTLALPPHVSGHVGYAVVPWRQRRGHATRALGLMLPIARELGLPRVLVTCDTDNHASRRVIEANGGVADGEEAGIMPDEPRKLRFWIDLAGGAR